LVIYLYDIIVMSSLFFKLYTVTNKCKIISQIIKLLHVSTLSCHPQGACNQNLAELHKYFKCSCWKYIYNQDVWQRLFASSHII